MKVLPLSQAVGTSHADQEAGGHSARRKSPARACISTAASSWRARRRWRAQPPWERLFRSPPKPATSFPAWSRASSAPTRSRLRYKDITNYNNFYEFSTDKYEPAGLAKNFRTRPWTVKVEGMVQKPKTYDIDSLLKLATLEDRVYRHRCVEGWSMVIPWVGYSLSKLIEPGAAAGQAKYVEFTTLDDPAQMPGHAPRRARLALHRRPAAGRSQASAHAADLRPLRRSAAQPGWRAGAHRASVEVRLQELQVDRAASASPTSSRRPRGTSPRPTNTASTPT